MKTSNGLMSRDKFHWLKFLRHNSMDFVCFNAGSFPKKKSRKVTFCMHFRRERKTYFCSAKPEFIHGTESIVNECNDLSYSYELYSRKDCFCE